MTTASEPSREGQGGELRTIPEQSRSWGPHLRRVGAQGPVKEKGEATIDPCLEVFRPRARALARGAVKEGGEAPMVTMLEALVACSLHW